MKSSVIFMFAAVCAGLAAQEAPPSEGDKCVVSSGEKIPLSLMNTLSSKQAAEGDRVYLETMFPVLVDGRIVIPAGTYVNGTITQVKRPAKARMPALSDKPLRWARWSVA